MFRTVGENAEYGDESASYGSDDESRYSHSTPDYDVAFREPLSDQLHGNSDGSESPKLMKKMFWHAMRIDKVQELVPEQIRWLYKEDPKSKWVAFIGYDSLRIECRYRALEYARLRSNSMEEDDIDTHIHVRGGLYEVDINNSVVHPVYWKGTSLPILRGTWFVDGTGQPLEYEYSLQLEQDHLAKFMGRSIPEPHGDEKKAGKAEVLHNVQFSEFHVDWYNVDECYMFSEAKSSRMFRYLTTKLNIQKPGTGTRLYRGYYEEAKMDDKPPDVTHLVFVVHGIGQKYNQNRIISCCNDLRNGTAKLIPKYFPALTSSYQKVEFLPVEWRTDLHLDGDLVESITPEKLRNLRVILNSTAMDILYYTSPLYRGEIISGLNSELNRLYDMFVERHPYFEANNGQVSICAHSLGSVILYDILTGWDPIELYDQYVCKILRDRSGTDMNESDNLASITSSERSKRLHDFYINSITKKESTSLSFKVSNMFSLGSPLGVFLTLRGMRPRPNGLMDHLLPKTLCKRFYNIYHPSDPVAYRIEPLVLKHYSTIAPLKIHKIHDPKKMPYSQMKSKAYAAFGHASKKVKGLAKKGTTDSPSPVRVDSDSSQSLVEIGAAAHQPSTSHGAVTHPPSTSKNSTGATAARTPSDSTSAAEAAVPSGGLTGAVKGFFSRFGGSKLLAHEKLAKELDDYSSIASEEDTDDLKSDSTDGVEHTDLEYRLDYALPSGSMTNSYVSALFSHTSYWSSPEVALFLLSHIFPDYGPVK